MATRTFDPPGPGTWELDATHFYKPATRYKIDALHDSFNRGFQYGTERYGLLLSHLEAVYIHGFCYMQPVLAVDSSLPPEHWFEEPALLERFANGRKAIENKLWREDLRRWDEDVKPDSIRRQNDLQAVAIESLDTEALIRHLEECRDNVGLMWFRHHEFTIPSLIPTGLYLNKACAWSGASPSEALDLLKGSSPVSAGLAADELAVAASALRDAGAALDQHRDLAPDKVLADLMVLPAPAGPAVTKYVEIVAYQLTSGYDITERFALEMPEVLVGNLCSAMTGEEAAQERADLESRRDAIRERVPAEHRAEFDELLEEARLHNRLRDERGVYNEAKAFGLARRAILEAGRRIAAGGRLYRADALVHASHEEMLAMLRGEEGPSEDELREREAWYAAATTDDAPDYLGPAPQPPPPPEALPEDARLGEAAIGAVLVNVFDPPVAALRGDLVSGSSVSPGVYEGTARIIQSPEDFHRLQQGDVLVTRNTSATFNVVLPMLGALVTDRGGLLSHAAIVAREYGIPGIVSTRNATRVIPDGSRVRVDGGSGTVEVLS